MDAVTEGQDVVVIDRRHYLSYEEGVVTRAKPDADGRVRVHFPMVEGEPQNPDDWRAIELFVLGPVPHAGERYEWADRNNASRAPFTVGTRFTDSHHRWAGLFPILSDEATPMERKQGYSSIASAAELAKFADRSDTPAPNFSPPAMLPDDVPAELVEIACRARLDAQASSAEPMDDNEYAALRSDIEAQWMRHALAAVLPLYRA